jgi:hypothetical protein
MQAEHAQDQDLGYENGSMAQPRPRPTRRVPPPPAKYQPHPSALRAGDGDHGRDGARPRDLTVPAAQRGLRERLRHAFPSPRAGMRGRDVIVRPAGYSIAGVPGLIAGADVQAMLTRRGQVPVVLIFGWPTPIPLTARCTLPPLPHKPVYGPQARAEARALMAEAMRRRVQLGWYTKSRLREVAKGQRPLDYRLWYRTRVYTATVAEQRRRDRERRERPLRVNLRVMGFGEGPTLVHRPELYDQREQRE